MGQGNAYDAPFCQSHLYSLDIARLLPQVIPNNHTPGNASYNNSGDQQNGSTQDSDPELSRIKLWDTLLSRSDFAPVTYLGWFQILLSLLCCFGVCGNLVTLVVLTKKQLCCSPGKLETSANLGLAALAVSDLLFCVVVLPHSFLSPAPARPWEESTVYPHQTTAVFLLYYSVYGVSAINLFIMTSTWLIVTLAVERYIALYYPLQAKSLLSVRHTQIVIAAVYILSCLLTLPYFLNYSIRTCMGLDSRLRLERVPRLPEASAAHVSRVYIRHVWPAVAVFLPLTILLFCNVKLIQGLRQVRQSRRQSCPGQTVKEVNARITLTLTVIVAVALLLVTPGEIFKVLNPYTVWGSRGAVVSAVLNVLQTVSFSFNFVLYCVVDRHFRLMCRTTLLRHCYSASAAQHNASGDNSSKNGGLLQRQGTGTTTLHT